MSIVITSPGIVLHPPVEAIVAEEDTYLVLSADPTAREVNETPERLLARARDVEPLKPGTVVVQEGSPRRLLAVVHDLNEEPSWREEWVDSALREILRKVDELQLESIALPVLGTVHGTLEPRRFAELLRRTLLDAALKQVSTIWLMATPASTCEISEVLHDFDCKVHH